MLSGVVSPAPAPGVRGSGRWLEGRWGLGPHMLRDYRLFIPPGVSATRPAPLMVLLHGCGQDSASFAACTRAAAIARVARCMMLLPEQSSHANAQRCWNWFRGEVNVAAEAMLLMAILEHVCLLYPVRRDRVFALGISAGGSMALTLALRFPERFAAVGTHSGAVPHSAVNAVQAAQAMRGHRDPDTEGRRLRLAGRRLPPLIVLHGDADPVVAFDNAPASVSLWLDLLPQHAILHRSPLEFDRFSAARAGPTPSPTGNSTRGLTSAWFASRSWVTPGAGVRQSRRSRILPAPMP